MEPDRHAVAAAAADSGREDPPGSETPSLWRAAGAYERFMGRWSRRVATSFLDALPVPPGRSWLDVGCGTGILTTAIAERRRPSAVVGIDLSGEFLRHVTMSRPSGVPVQFQQGQAENLLFPDARFDAAVSGLTLNFTADPARALAEMVRVTRPGGTVAAYVWDYDHAGFFLTRFWDAAAASEVRRPPDDERGRWRVCSPAGLGELVARSCLLDPRMWAIQIETPFSSKDELWEGFLLGVGPSGTWAARLDPDRRARLHAHLDARLTTAHDGRVHLSAKAIAIIGTVPKSLPSRTSAP